MLIQTRIIILYLQGKNAERLAEALYMVEEFDGLAKLIHSIPEGSNLLHDIGDKFVSVGICEHAVPAYLRAGK